MTSLPRVLAAAVVTLGLALPYSLSTAADAAQAASRVEDPQISTVLRQAAQTVKAERARVARVKAARQRAIVKMTTPAWGKISARFGSKSRLWTERHTGMDIDARYGQPVRNLMQGKVIFAGRAGAYGRLVVVRTTRGGDVWYAHLSQIKKGIRVGKLVQSGKIIGNVGSSGHVTGAHLHLEIRRNDYPVNPAGFLWGKHRGNILKTKVPGWAYSDRVMHLSDL